MVKGDTFSKMAMSSKVCENRNIYYIDKSVLPGNKPLVNFVRSYIRDTSDVDVTSIIFPFRSLVFACVFVYIIKVRVGLKI